jgi:Heparan-alpha-glucosaminide N-acetyltransferase, catalytic
MASTALSSAAADRVAELDLLRGVAALLMVFNHVGYAALEPQSAQEGLSGAIVFLGSMAPVLFFFATGFGAGLAARPAAWRSLADKVLLLVLADQFLGWTLGRPLGLDFFGFIAVSMVAARLVLATPHPLAAAALGIVAVLALRYGLGQTWVAPPGGYGLVQWWVGTVPHHAVSYPAAPWLVYPLLGAALAVLYRRHRGVISPRVWMVVAAAIVVCAVAAGLVASHGGSFHRWGSVAAAFFALSVAVLLCCAAGSVFLTRRTPRLAAALSLGGVASFAVVPLHYFMVRSGSFSAQHDLAFYLAVAALIALLSFALSNAFERAAAALSRSPQHSRLVVAALFVVVVSAVATFAWARSGSPTAAQVAATLGQLAIGLLFAWRVGPFDARVPSRAVAPGPSKS